MASLCLTVAEVFFFLCAFYQRPQRPYWPPLGGLHCPLLAPRLPPLPPRLPPLAPPRGGPPYCPDPRAGPDPRPEPRPLWDGGSWPESHSGVGGGAGLGGEVGGCPFAAFWRRPGWRWRSSGPRRPPDARPVHSCQVLW
jgi:hypothetical protein